MSQGYHTNAKTNMHSREIIQQSTLKNTELAERFEIDEKTVSKWKNRDHLIDKSSRPHTIKRSLTDLEGEVIAGSRYFCESLFWASKPKQAAKT